MDGQVRDRLAMEIASIGRDGASFGSIDWETGEVLDERPEPAGREPFGAWLKAQKDRGDWIDDLAAAARKDPGFPKRGTPDEARAYLGLKGIGDPDVFEQLDDAERCWRSQ